MTDDRKSKGLGATERAKLLESLRADKKSERQSAGGGAARNTRGSATELKTTSARAFDFSTLPQVKQLAMQRAAADLMGIDNPFFRPHDALAAGETVIDGRRYDNFASYNYLGLNGHGDVTKAAKAAIERFGTSVSASRVVAGERPFHGELERALADLHGVEDAIVMVSGHATNVTTIGHLLGKSDLVLTDALIHNSISEGARLSGATRLNFRHNDLDALEDLLAGNRHKYERALIAVEGIYSMDGDYPDLPRLLSLKQDYDAWLLVDEAHSMGVMGKTGRGIAEHFGVDPQAVDIWMGTLSKTFSACGGYIAGSKSLCDYLRATAPGFVFSVGLSPALGAAALASIEVMKREPERIARLQENGRRFLEKAKAAGLNTGPSTGFAVVPVIVGDSPRAAILSNRLLKRGINALPIIFPAVAEKSARLRFFITSEHTPDQIDRAVEIVAEELTIVRGADFDMAALMSKSR